MWGSDDASTARHMGVRRFLPNGSRDDWQVLARPHEPLPTEKRTHGYDQSSVEPIGRRTQSPGMFGQPELPLSGC